MVAVLATANLFVPDLGLGWYADPTLIALGVAAILAFAAWLRTSGYLGTPHVLIGFTALAFVPGVLSAGANPYAQSKVLGLVGSFVMMLVVVQLLARERPRRHFVVALAILGIGVALFLSRYGETVTFLGRTSVAGLNPIGLGRMAALGALLASLAAMRTVGVRRLALVAVAIGAGVMAASTGSRGPVAAAALAAVLVALLVKREGSRILRILGVLLAGGLGLYLVAGLGLDDPGGIGRLLSGDSSGRNRLWADSMAVAFQHPAGIGFGNLYEHIALTPTMATTGDSQYTHNIFIETLVEGGVIALLGLVVLLVASYRSLRSDSTSPLGASILAVWFFALINANVSSDLVGNRLVWIMIGAGLALKLRDSQEARSALAVVTPWRRGRGAYLARGDATDSRARVRSADPE
ncbi:O-antigen ligase family protein [Occultella kanbiaonis]|uniref:O-antigen ligase family protein n=1 Tax=Occultella kanbiaonis TaxID=2675754 RepID=UPI0013D7E350|nr:O-antigen ligase family protein [Occultella kanbiaonis]